MTLTFAEQHEVFKNNVTLGMIEHFAEELGVTVESLETLGVGYYPGEYAWVFAERDAKGDIVGLLRRYHNGKKFTMEGSKRGLIYAYNSDHAIGDKKYEAGKFHWVRIANAGVICPVCAKPDWCMVSSDDPENPSAVLCSRLAEGRVREIPGSGHLHIIDAARNKGQGSSASTLPPTDLPIIIVEGASDVCAAMSIGFVAIGRPSAEGGMGILKEMPLAGKEVWIVGDNDAGAGKAGMLKTYLNIKGMTENIKCILPPEGIKDLRQWVQRGLTQTTLFEYVGEHGDDNKEIDPDLFASDVAFLIAERFINEHHMLNDVPILRVYHDQWRQWEKDHYEELKEEILRGDLYKFLKGKQCEKTNAQGVISVVPYKPTRAKINDILDALNTWCPIDNNPPCWIESRDGDPDPKNLMVFKNGVLDIEDYMQTNDPQLYEHTPRLFTFNAFPYDFDPEARSRLYEDTVNDILNGDKEQIRAWHQWIGYCLISDVSQEKLMFLIGGRRSGKGTMLNTFWSILGKNQCVSTTFRSVGSRFGLAGLENKLAATIGDARMPTKAEANAALEVMLQISGGDTVTIEPKFKLQHDAQLGCRFTIAMNELPGFVDPALAFAARSIILKFPNDYLGKEDITLKRRLKEEASQGKLINYALDGLQNLRKQGGFTMPKSSEELIKALEETNAPVLAFVGECCIKIPSAIIPRNQLYEAWAYWCNKTGHKYGNENYFGRWFKQACPTVEDARLNFDGRRQYCYRGITLQDWVYSQYLGKPKQ